MILEKVFRVAVDLALYGSAAFVFTVGALLWLRGGRLEWHLDD